MLNSITLAGRITKAPEYRETDSYKQCKFTIAVDRDYAKDGKREADFIRCIAWNSASTFIHSYFDKGDMIVLKGRLQIDIDKSEGYKEYASVVVESAYFGGAKKSDDEKPRPAGRAVDIDDSQERFTELNGEDSDLPF